MDAVQTDHLKAYGIVQMIIKKGITVANLANSFAYEGTRFQGLCDAAKTCLKAMKS